VASSFKKNPQRSWDFNQKHLHSCSVGLFYAVQQGRWMEEEMDLEASAISTQPLDHLGLIAAIVKQIGLEEKIDKQLPLNAEMGVSVSMGKRVHAMILNGLGFINTRLYMFSKFRARNFC
jgi:Domain of unknown function (DUF4277)